MTDESADNGTRRVLEELLDAPVGRRWLLQGGGGAAAAAAVLLTAARPWPRLRPGSARARAGANGLSTATCTSRWVTCAASIG